MSNEGVNKRQLLKERLKRHQKAYYSARRLNFWLAESEYNVELAHVFPSLQDNRQDSEQLLIRCNIVDGKVIEKMDIRFKHGVKQGNLTQYCGNYITCSGQEGKVCTEAR